MVRNQERAGFEQCGLLTWDGYVKNVFSGGETSVLANSIQMHRLNSENRHMGTLHTHPGDGVLLQEIVGDFANHSTNYGLVHLEHTPEGIVETRVHNYVVGVVNQSAAAVILIPSPYLIRPDLRVLRMIESVAFLIHESGDTLEQDIEQALLYTAELFGIGIYLGKSLSELELQRLDEETFMKIASILEDYMNPGKK